jgi:hypothetical protein
MLGKAHLCVTPAGGFLQSCAAHTIIPSLFRAAISLFSSFSPHTPASVSSSGRPVAPDARSEQRDH